MINAMVWIVFAVLVIFTVLCGLLALGQPDGHGFVLQFAISGVLLIALLVMMRP